MAKSRLFWSARGFLHSDVHDDIPADAVPISAATHARLLAGQAEGQEIVAGAGGKPVLADPGGNTETDLRARLLRRTRREARRRILAIASLERQSNDNAALALAAFQLASLGGTSIDTAPALRRRAAIDALRAACDDICVQVEQLPVSRLRDFDPSLPAIWLAEK